MKYQHYINTIIQKFSVPMCTLMLSSFSFSHSAIAAEGPNHATVDSIRKSPLHFPELIFQPIPGAPKLTAPKLVMGKTKPVMGEGMGWASPAFFDVDGDGKKDLLVGEFASGMENNGTSVGNFVRVYKNVGSDAEPSFHDHFTYLRPASGFSNGTPLSIDTWCCLGFTPRLVDVDQDGQEDLVTGHYDPGYVTWFRRTDEGFMSGQKLPQFGDHMLGRRKYVMGSEPNDPDNFSYWNYSSADLGDFTGDGLPDLIIGGSSLRISRNIGVKGEPSFARRELLLDTAGKPLQVLTRNELIVNPGWKDTVYGHSMIPLVVDWDRDGVLDLIVSDGYVQDLYYGITFFKGVRGKNETRFEPGKPLFYAKDGGKALPGSYLHIAATDWNGDGILDLLIGTSVATDAGTFNPEIAWGWEKDSKSIKLNPYLYSEATKQGFAEDLERRKAFPESYQRLFEHYYGKESYMNLVHQGYIYVLLGEQ